MTREEFYLNDDGIRLHAKLDRPDAPEKCPLCIVIHGLTGNMEERQNVAVSRAMNISGSILAVRYLLVPRIFLFSNPNRFIALPIELALYSRPRNPRKLSSRKNHRDRFVPVILNSRLHTA